MVYLYYSFVTPKFRNPEIYLKPLTKDYFPEKSPSQQAAQTAFIHPKPLVLLIQTLAREGNERSHFDRGPFDGNKHSATDSGGTWKNNRARNVIDSAALIVPNERIIQFGASRTVQPGVPQWPQRRVLIYFESVFTRAANDPRGSPTTAANDWNPIDPRRARVSLRKSRSRKTSFTTGLNTGDSPRLPSAPRLLLLRGRSRTSITPLRSA